MKQNMKWVSVLGLAASLGMGSGLAWADGKEAKKEGLPSREEMWQMLQKQQKELDQLKSQLSEARQTIQSTREESQVATDNLARKVEEKVQVAAPESKPASSWTDKVKLGGEVKVQAAGTENFNRTRTSDITVSQVQLNLDAAINELVSLNVVLLHEEDATELVDVDKATVTVGDAAKGPVYVTAGLMAVPFGTFSTNMISDPLTLTLAETKETALQLGFNASGFYGSVYAFNGDANRTVGNDVIRQGGIALGYQLEKGDYKLDVGAGLMQGLEDAGTVWTSVSGRSATIQSNIGAAGAHMNVQVGKVNLFSEYLMATEQFQVGEMAFNGRGAKPRVWSTELGYTFDLMGKETVASVGYQGTREALDLALPKNRLLAGLSVGILENTKLGFEWHHDTDYNTGTTASGATTGTGRETDAGLMEVKVGF
ncbi:MAG: LbtU family siderophore porin [Magnetococcales bacterium]|nr:LbtU family siderophore porin [Magnetococcales bacterium]